MSTKTIHVGTLGFKEGLGFFVDTLDGGKLQAILVRGRHWCWHIITETPGLGFDKFWYVG